ncbi:MAG: DUF4430 domain-containing protein [Bacillota bacterium]|nr:DUF4430 domain-containing protein [Bacillota bacterium]
MKATIQKKGSFVVMLIVIIALVISYVVINKKLDADPNTKNITLIVVHSDGSEFKHSIRTNALNLEDAIYDDEIVKGEDGAYGLYITEVDGEFAKYEVNNAYWAMYRDDVALETGAKDTIISDGETYRLVYTKL